MTASIHPFTRNDDSRPRHKLRVLIVDDDRDTANTLAALLRDEGDDVHISLRGDDALEASRLFRPDVLIADINMPGISGYALAQQVRERYGQYAPLMIGISGVWKNASDRLLAQTVGFDHHLVKPADFGELSALIEPLRRSQSSSNG